MVVENILKFCGLPSRLQIVLLFTYVCCSPNAFRGFYYAKCVLLYETFVIYETLFNI